LPTFISALRKPISGAISLRQSGTTRLTSIGRRRNKLSLARAWWSSVSTSSCACAGAAPQRVETGTGTGNFSVPLELPPGRNGFQPQLQLTYSTGNPNGPFGLGWALSVPAVRRKTSKGVPLYDDGRDVFILSGAEDLVPVSSDGEGKTTYRPRTEGLLARIVHHREKVQPEREKRQNYWEVRTKDGLVSLYGTPRPADAPEDWKDPATIADPDGAAKIFGWNLTETTDPFENRIEYEYEHDDQPVDGPDRWDHLRLRQVRYVDYAVVAEPQLLVDRVEVEVHLGHELRLELADLEVDDQSAAARGGRRAGPGRTRGRRRVCGRC
jgi:hypothetical protein